MYVTCIYRVCTVCSQGSDPMFKRIKATCGKKISQTVCSFDFKSEPKFIIICLLKSFSATMYFTTKSTSKTTFTFSYMYHTVYCSLNVWSLNIRSNIQHNSNDQTFS